MKKVYLGNFSAPHSKKIWAPIAFLMSTIYFGGLLANWNRHKDIHMEEELFVPSITIVKTGIARSLSGGAGCDRIEYTYTVTNTSTNGEVLGPIEVTDALVGGIVPGPNPGSDINNDNEMDPGEIWTYTAYYTIQEVDILNGQVSNQANVTAGVQGQPGVEVSDISDDGTPMDGEETVIDLTACQPNISVIKTGGLAIDGFGQPNCGIALYNFEVKNESTFQRLQTVVLNDPLLGGDLGAPNPLSDVGNDGIMEPGETWTYGPIAYNIQPADIANGQVSNQATVTAVTLSFPNIGVNDMSDDNSTLENDQTVIDLTLCQGGISLIKTGAAVADIDAGVGCNFIVYSFTVTNESAQVLSNVDLSDPLLGNNSPNFDDGDANNNNLLDPGEVWLYSAIYNITVDDINAGQVINQAEVTADVQALPGVTVSDLSDNDSPLEDEPTVVDLTACQAGISLIKTGQAFSLSGAPGCDVIQYTFEVDNTSIFYDLDNVILNDPLLGNALAGPDSGDSNNNNILETNETWIYIAYYNITETDITNGEVINQATVAADVQGLPGIIVSDDSDNNSPLENDPTIVDLSACQPGIYAIKTGQALDMSGGPGCDVVRYTIEVVNSSWIYSLDNVVLTDPLLGVGPIPGPDPGEDVGNDGILAPGETWTFSANYDITEADITNGQVVNQATVTADVQGQPGESVLDLSDNDSPSEDDATIVDLMPCQPGIYLIKTGQAFSISGGQGCDVIQYTFEVVNSSWVYTLENIVLNDPLMGGVLPGPDSGDDNNDTFLNPGETWIYNAIYNITPADIINGQVINQADVIADVQGQPGETVSDLSDNDNPMENDPTIVGLGHCQNPSLGLIKEGLVVDVNADGCMESILYTFNLTNTGDVDLYGVFIEDPLFGGQIPGPVNGTDANDDGVHSVGETWTYEALYAITQQDINNTLVDNQASATGFTNVNVLAEDLSDDDSLLEDNPTTTPVPSDACTDGPQIGLIKVGTLVDINGDGCVESVLYNFTVTNTGGIDLDEVSLEDPLFGGQIPGPLNGTDANNDGILSVGETWTYEVLYAITQNDIDSGTVNNQATVTAEPVGFDNQVFDLSDNDSLLENEMTSTAIPNDACTNGGAGIGLIKEGTLINVDLDENACIDSIIYVFTVTNTGSTNLVDVSLQDPLLGNNVLGPISGSDQGEDGILSVGETWTYEVVYAITQDDIDNGVVVNQATVTAVVEGSNNQVFDLSDDDSLAQNEPTSTPVPANACTNGGARLGLIKQGTLVDTNSDGCVETVRYTFTVTNNSQSASIDNIVLMDPLLGGQITGPIIGSDDNNDGILSPSETWTYEADYYLVQVDIDNGNILNQAVVTGEPVGFDIQLMDLSDNDSYTENEMTETIVPSDACTDGGTPIGFEIFNGITPNGDGSNDYFRILGIENYPDNQLKIYNRWGVLVYESEQYGQGNNLFYGISEGRATFQKDKELPSGTYFYILTFTGTNPGKDSYSGYLYINRD